MDGIYTMASSSVSSLYGNVGCAIRELILSKFPYDYFKYTNVSTEVAFKNMRRQFGSNTNNEIAKRKRPYLIIQPQYQEPDQDGFLQNVPLTKNEMDVQYGVDARYLFDIIHDYDSMYDLKFKLNRDRLEYEVTLSLSTQMQQLDIYKAMMNQITWDRWMYYPAALESVIPKTMIRYMSKLCGMDIDKNPDMIPQFIKHLNDNSAYPITYKIRNASATDEYFMYYTHRLMVLFQDINLSDGSMKGMINDAFNITFKVIVEFNLPGLYILSGNVEKLRGFQMSIGTGDIHSENSEYMPLFSVTNLFNRYPKKMDGLTLYSAYIFNTEAGKKLEDTLDLSAVFSQEQAQAIKFQTDHGVMPETVARLFILRNGVETSDWEVDWMTLTLKIKHPDDQASYRLILYVNMDSMNEILANSRITGPYDQHTLRTNTIDYSKVEGRIHTVLDPDYEGDTEFKADIPGTSDIPVPNIFRADSGEAVEHPDTHEAIVALPSDRVSHQAFHDMENVVDGMYDIEAEPSKTAHTHPGTVATLDLGEALKGLQSSIEADHEAEIKNQEKVIMKYSSSIFDDPNTVIAEAPIPKAKFTSSANPNRSNPKVTYRDNPNPGVLKSIDVWAKIISTAMMYNFANAIAIEKDDKNYALESVIEPPPED